VDGRAGRRDPRRRRRRHAGQLSPTLDLAVARFRDVRELRRELADRRVIERAQGRLIAGLNLTEEQAFRRMRRHAMDSRRSLGEVARALLRELGEA
jgi:response regulator NasT